MTKKKNIKKSKKAKKKKVECAVWDTPGLLDDILDAAKRIPSLRHKP